MEPLLLIPGMMCDARLWGRVSPGLTARPLHHFSPTGSDSMAALAAEALATAPPVFALAGLSMGGIVAMEILAQAPQRVTRLALLDTNPLAELPEVQARRQPQIDRALAGDLAGVLRDEMKPNYLANPAADILDLCMALALALGPEVFRRQSLALRDRADRTEALRAFRRPALVLMGEHDRLCPRSRHELMHSLMPQSVLSIIPGAGHLPPLEQPDLTLQSLTQWLES